MVAFFISLNVRFWPIEDVSSRPKAALNCFCKVLKQIRRMSAITIGNCLIVETHCDTN